jgi:hypothetical protein
VVLGEKGTGCLTATPATEPSMQTAAWQKCSASVCDCVRDRSDVPGEAVPLGCARHFAKGGDARNLSSGIDMSTKVCYVKGGISCARNPRSDSVIPDVAWRDCSKDCYGIGSSFSPATRASCSCFNASKPDRFEKRSRISIFNDVDSQPSIHAIASQMLKVLIEEKLGIPTEIGTA